MSNSPSDRTRTALRIVHSADNHIGLGFRQYPDAVRDRLIAERFSALSRLVQQANDREAHFLVIAGDLFDRTTVSSHDIKQCIKVLSAFSGQQVLVLAGNHDYCEGPDSTLWTSFRKAAQDTNVLAMTEAKRHVFQVNDCAISFYACPCPSKTGADSTIGWVAKQEKSTDTIHIGVAHGNVEGIGLDANHRYFNMTRGDLSEANVLTWLLGHIHVPYPTAQFVGVPPFFMAGTHAPDSVRCRHQGHAWFIEITEDRSCSQEQLNLGHVHFVRLERELFSAADLRRLRDDCQLPNAPSTVLDLKLSGRLYADDLEAVQTLVDELTSAFLHVDCENDLITVLDAGAIAKLYPEGTLPFRLLNTLLEDDVHPGDAQVALELIQGTSR